MKYWITWTSTPESLDMGGAPPRTDALIGPAACGRCPNPDSLKRRASARALSLLTLLNMVWTSLESLNSRELLEATLPAFATAPSNARRSAGRSPWKPTIYEVQDRAKAVTSQSNAWKPTCEDEQSFPEETRTDHVTAKRASRVFQSNTWKPTWKPNQSIQPASTTKASIISISDWTGKYDLNAVTKHTYLFVIFAGWLSYETGNNVIISTLTSKLPYVCVCLCIY